MVSGAILAYWKRNPSFALLGPASGYICCTALFDLVMPWQAFLIALPGPILLFLGLKLVVKLGLDEPKTAPLTLLPATYSIIMTGIVGNGRPAGGVMGVSSGPYARLHSHISVGQQLLGLTVMVPIIAGLALSAILLIENTFGLRVTPQRELERLDSFWTAPRQP